MRPFRCEQCGVEPPFCPSCSEKQSVHETFPWTVSYIEETFGPEHVEICLQKQYLPYG